MSKFKERKEKEIPGGHELVTDEHLNRFEKEASKYNSEEEMMVGLKAVVYHGPERVIRLYEGLQGHLDPITGLTFTSDIPYALYSHLATKLQERAGRKKYAEQKQLEEYEEMSQQHHE
ncbi:MAG: hypothetical protein KW793_03585 [Candidatus Doudnabacteria bacterium]|nr:hypothetical protein [Candidatus Doudnabacteria bacterium]